MTALELKNYIYKNGKIPFVLESIGCGNITYHEKKDYYSCSNAVGGDCNNPAAINIKNDSYLNYRNYTRNVSYDDINKKIDEFKHEDGLLYAIYGTPAESLCGLQVEQFRKMYGIIPGVSDREYVSNSFHCGVWENITPIEKQNLENRFWNLFNGGKIQYVRYPINYNREAVVTLVRRAMDLGYYEGVNLSLAYCDDCGHSLQDMTSFQHLILHYSLAIQSRFLQELDVE